MLNANNSEGLLNVLSGWENRIFIYLLFYLLLLPKLFIYTKAIIHQTTINGYTV